MLHGAFSTAGRHAASMVVPAVVATSASTYSSPSSNFPSSSTVSCDASVASGEPVVSIESALLDKPRQDSSQRLRKRMTSIGLFSLRSETLANPSLPAMFVALSGEAKPPAKQSSNVLIGGDKGMTYREFENLWKERNMSLRHERFQSRVSADHEGYFEPSTQDLQHYVRETLPFTSAYRTELKRYIEHILTHKLDVTDKLWEACISTGPLGSSGAISKSRVRSILHEAAQQSSSQQAPTGLKETVVVLRAHHALADGVSLGAALSDLSDEAEDINRLIGQEIQRRKRMKRKKRKQQTKWEHWLEILKKVIRYWIISGIKSLARHGYLMLVSNNPFQTYARLINGDVNAHDEDAKKDRSVSWCDAAPLEEVKRVAQILQPGATINDVFVSCVTYAVTRQLEVHRQRAVAALRESVSSPPPLPLNLNVVVPVHLYGGILLPGQSMGNRIGAMVTRLPGRMTTPLNEDGVSATPRLQAVSSSLQECKRSPAPYISYLAATLCSNLLPSSLAKFLMKNANANASVVVTNVRGPPMKLHWNGRTVEAAVGFVPLPPGVPVGVVVQSYAGGITLSVTAEKEAVPDADLFLQWVLEEYERLNLEAQAKHRALQG